MSAPVELVDRELEAIVAELDQLRLAIAEARARAALLTDRLERAALQLERDPVSPALEAEQLPTRPAPWTGEVDRNVDIRHMIRADGLAWKCGACGNENSGRRVSCAGCGTAFS